MVWRPKTGAPVLLDLGAELARKISGNPNLGWIGAYVPLLGQDLVATADMCASGPPAGGALTLSDFIQALTPFGTFALPKRIEEAAISQIFNDYCESPPPQGAQPTWTQVWAEVNGPADDVTYWVPYNGADNTGQNYRFHVHKGPGPYGPWADYGVGNDAHQYVWEKGGFPVDGLAPDEWWSVGPGAFTQIGYLITHPGQWPQGSIALEKYMAPPTDIYNPPALNKPAGLNPPAAGVYATIADLGKELDSLEMKAETALSLLRYLATFANPATPLTSSPTPTDATPGHQVPTSNAVGCVVQVAGVPAAVSMDFADVTTLLNLGRVTLWTQYGPLSPIKIEHNPLVILPFPPGVTGVSVGVMPPATATVQLLYPPK
jgi:hypothetical protein